MVAGDDWWTVVMVDWSGSDGKLRCVGDEKILLVADDNGVNIDVCSVELVAGLAEMMLLRGNVELNAEMMGETGINRGGSDGKLRCEGGEKILLVADDNGVDIDLCSVELVAGLAEMMLLRGDVELNAEMMGEAGINRCGSNEGGGEGDDGGVNKMLHVADDERCIAG